MANQFTIYWLDGKKSVLEGDTVHEAFSAAGYSRGAVRAVDWYENGVNDDYVWNPEKKEWEKKTSDTVKTS